MVLTHALQDYKQSIHFFQEVQLYKQCYLRLAYSVFPVELVGAGSSLPDGGCALQPRSNCSETVKT